MDSKNTPVRVKSGGTQISRRTVARGVAWSAPIAAIGVAAGRGVWISEIEPQQPSGIAGAGLPRGSMAIPVIGTPHPFRRSPS